MNFENIKYFLSKNETKTRTDLSFPPSSTIEPDKRRVTRNKFARLSARTKAA